MRVRALVGLEAIVTLAGCGWTSEPDALYHIDRTRALGTRVEVVEVGPVWPARISGDPDDAPITQAMPGDRVRLSAMIVDAEARALPSEDFDVLWLQCGSGCTAALPKCRDVDWTSSSNCELGRGGELEFEIPASFLAIEFGRYEIDTLAIIALEPDIDARACARAWAEANSELAKCALVHGKVMLGSRWALLGAKFEAGLPIDFPIYEVPWPAFAQPANRVPMPGLPSWFDADTGEPLTGEPPRIRAGQRIRTEGPNWRVADRQPIVEERLVASVDPFTFVFLGSVEELAVLWYVVDGLSIVDVFGEEVELLVDDHVEPGLVRVVMVFGDFRDLVDRRFDSLDFRVIELEVVE
ncbi:hypothetical protein ACNOYE_37225 [Nannocystaceae bacterium ST9]